ncbi:MAG: adenylate/guanylate cyclase domain-containing protein [Acidimicrobiales bacterium]
MTAGPAAGTVAPAHPADPAARATADLFVPYLPRLVVNWQATTPELRHRSVEGSLVFVDISGFTKLSEGLSKQGKIGAEELAAIINECFVGVLALAYADGAQLLKFGGDALLLFFSGPDHESRACRAAFAMRRHLRTAGRLNVLGQRVNLRMSIGIHSGLFDMFLVGASHRELVVTGPAVSTVVSMESTATAGQILVSERTATALRPSDLGEARGDGLLLCRPPTAAGPFAATYDPVLSTGDPSHCVPAAIRSSIHEAHREPEHRRVTVAFVHFDGTDAMLESAGPDAVAEYLHTLVADVQEAVDQRGVTFIGTDADHDGGKIILVAGAPSSSGEDEHHMLLALRQIMDRERQPALRVGVNTGRVFAADIGPPYRRTFTVMGDTVNLAARLMAKASPGSILATPVVLSRSGSEFEVSDVAPFFVKGKAKAVRAVEVGPRLGARSLDASDQLPLVGRAHELGVWRAMVHAAMRGSGSAVELVGEPGVGKSRLVEEFRREAATMRILATNCEYYQSSIPYGALRGLVRELLGIEQASGGAEARERLSSVLADAHLLQWAPLVGTVADVDMPDTRETAELDPEFRAQRLGRVMTLLLGELVDRPTVFVIEDTHWMDEASGDLLRHLTASIGWKPCLFCYTRRDVETGFVGREPDVSRMKLEPLDGAAATELVQMAMSANPLPAQKAAALAERSGGNPLFLRELLAEAHEGGDLESLPDSVEAVIAARIDRLSTTDRHFLRRVSVLGRSAPRELLAAVLEAVPGPGDDVWDRLADFIATYEEGNVVFRHALLRDGAYDGLSYRLRRELHGRVADTVRDAAADHSDEQAEVLSFHYLHAQRLEEAWRYSLVAAERACAVYANFEASEFFERALVASRRLTTVSVREVAAVREALADARHRSGDYMGAVQEYRAGRRLTGDDRLAQARLMLKLARVQGWLDRYSNALRWITRALKILDGAEDPEAQRQRAQLLSWYARFCQEQGHHERAISWCLRAVPQAELADEKDALVNALGVLDWAKMELGQLESPTNWRRGLALSEEIGDLQGQATMLNSLGMFAYFRGRWNEALELYGQAQERARRVGNLVQLAFYENNVAEIALDQGRIEEAEHLFESVSRTWRAAGYRSGAAYVSCNLGRCAAESGRFDEAMQRFQEAQREEELLGSHADLVEIGARWAETELLAGNIEAALTRAEAEIERARSMGGGHQMSFLHRVRAVALARSGELDAARRALQQSLEAARARQMDFEVALTLKVVAELGIDCGGEGPAAAAESRRILETLGVRSSPDLLGMATARG